MLRRAAVERRQLRVKQRAFLLATGVLVLALVGCKSIATHEAGQDRYGYAVTESSANASYSAVQKTSPDIPDPYDGSWMGRAHVDGGASQTSYARGVMGAYSYGGEGYYGAAFYFPPGTFTGAQPKQTGDIDIMGWEDGAGNTGGVRILPNHKAVLVKGDTMVEGGSSFDLREGCWNWLVVHQRGSSGDPAEPTPLTQVSLNGEELFQSDKPNSFGDRASTMRFGIVSAASNQSSNLDVYVDNAYVSPDEKIGPIGSNVCKPRPNVLFIVSDDQRIGTLGDPDPTVDTNGDGDPANDYWMPNTLKWFKNGDPQSNIPGGTEFTQAFATNPLCCPSRTSIFTGLYSHNHGVLYNDEATNSCDNQSQTLQSYLEQVGYTTGIFGKYLSNWVPGGLSCPGFQPRVPPYFDEYAVTGGEYRNFQAFTNVDGNPAGELKTIDSNYSPAEEQYSPTYVKDKALDFIRRHPGGTQPWFLYVAPAAPHSANDLTQRYGPGAWADMTSGTPYDGIDAPHYSPPVETDRSDKPQWVQQWGDDKWITSSGLPCQPGDPDCKRYLVDDRQIFERPGYPGYQEQQYRVLKPLDDLVDGLFRELQLEGEADNTLAIFISDNGYMWREHGLGRVDCSPYDPSPPADKAQCGPDEKGQPYLPSVRVPMLMRWPSGSNLGTDDDRLVGNIDLAPTALDAVGPTPSDFGQPPMDGRSLLDGFARSRMLTEGGLGKRDLSVWSSKQLVPPWASTITPPGANSYQYTEYYDDTDDRNGVDTGFKEYYDLGSDPDELTNGFSALNPNRAAMLSAQLGMDRICKGHGEVTGSPGCP